MKPASPAAIAPIPAEPDLARQIREFKQECVCIQEEEQSLQALMRSFVKPALVTKQEDRRSSNNLSNKNRSRMKFPL